MSVAIGGLPQPPLFQDEPRSKRFTAAWAGWLTQLQTILMATSQSGPTTARPSPSYVGQFYFDTTLGLPVWAKTLGSSPVWVNATGTPA